MRASAVPLFSPQADPTALHIGLCELSVFRKGRGTDPGAKEPQEMFLLENVPERLGRRRIVP